MIQDLLAVWGLTLRALRSPRVWDGYCEDIAILGVKASVLAIDPEATLEQMRRLRNAFLREYGRYLVEVGEEAAAEAARRGRPDANIALNCASCAQRSPEP